MPARLSCSERRPGSIAASKRPMRGRSRADALQPGCSAGRCSMRQLNDVSAQGAPASSQAAAASVPSGRKPDQPLAVPACLHAARNAPLPSCGGLCRPCRCRGPAVMYRMHRCTDRSNQSVCAAPMLVRTDARVVAPSQRNGCAVGRCPRRHNLSIVALEALALEWLDSSCTRTWPVRASNHSCIHTESTVTAMRGTGTPSTCGAAAQTRMCR